MAKAKSGGAIDDDSKGHLDQARRGKPRRFVMICKGTQVLSLVLYKKGSVDKYKKQAKEAGTGQLYFGVVEGKAADLTFRLARADGFESEPTRAAVMKDFLAEQADLKCKPAFEIVDTHSPLLDPDDPLHARLLRAQAAIPAAQAQPAQEAEMRSLAGEAAQLLEQDRRAEAEPQVVRLEQLLGRPVAAPAASAAAAASPSAAPSPSAAAGAPASATAPAASPSPAAPSPSPSEAFVQRLAALKPRLDEALALGVPLSGKVKEAASQVAALARKGEFATALAQMPSLEALIQQTIESRPEPPPAPPLPPMAGPDPAALELQRLSEAADALGPQVMAALQAHPGRRDEILQPVARFQKHLTAKEAGAAQQALHEVHAVLTRLSGAAAPATATAPAAPGDDSLVVLQQARLDWDRTRKAVEGELQTLEQAILEACREEPDFAEIEAGTKNLYAMLSTLDTRLGDKLDEALNAPSGELRSTKRREALAIAESYLDYVIEDDLINDIDDNGFLKVGVRLRLVATLNDLVSRLVA